MNYLEMIEAVKDAEKTLRIADQYSTELAHQLIGRLRRVNTPNNNWDTDPLAELKRELKGYNAQTHTWKD